MERSTSTESKDSGHFKERLMKYHGVNPKKFPLYLTELEFRYNPLQDDLYDDLVKCIYEYRRWFIFSNHQNFICVK